MAKWHYCFIKCKGTVSLYITDGSTKLVKNTTEKILILTFLLLGINSTEISAYITKTFIRTLIIAWSITNKNYKQPTSLSIQFSAVTQSCLTLRNLMDYSMPGLPVHHQLLEFTQTHVHWVSDAIQPSHPLSSPSPPAPNPSQIQGLFKWVSCLHQVAKILELQLQHQSFQWTLRTDLL